MYTSPQIVAGPDGRDAASVTTYPYYTVLAFRGTLTGCEGAFDDWLNDFRADLVSDPRFPGRVHGGFLNALDNLLPSIFIPQNNLRTYITGHSKGGALAVLAGWLLRGTDPTVVTFAAPRCGNSRFAHDYNVPTYRFENRTDRVPSLPPFLYSPAGCTILSPLSFTPPEGLSANHTLDTGYKPWAM